MFRNNDQNCIFFLELIACGQKCLQGGLFAKLSFCGVDCLRNEMVVEWIVCGVNCFRSEMFPEKNLCRLFWLGSVMCVKGIVCRVIGLQSEMFSEWKCIRSEMLAPAALGGNIAQSVGNDGLNSCSTQWYDFKQCLNWEVTLLGIRNEETDIRKSSSARVRAI